MKNDRPEKVWKRFVIFGFLLLGVLWVLDRTAYKARIEEERNQSVLEALQGNNILADEINVLFHGVQDDFYFFETEILDLVNLDPNSIRYKTEVKSLVKFLETHAGYFMVRLTDSSGKELFKILQENSGKYTQSNELLDLSKESFYQELNTVRGDTFFFSSMEPLIVNGRIAHPVKPTVRISKRIHLSNGQLGLLIFNIDGEKILEFFANNKRFKHPANNDEILLHASGHYIASFPFLDKEQYVFKKKTLEELTNKKFEALKKSSDLQGSVSTKKGLLVYSKIQLPQTNESWFLISKIPKETWEAVVHHKRMTWIFWGLLCFVILMVWYWKHEQKRYKDEVVEVLLKERNEFIQNVSHQLKTPLAILYNSLNTREPSRIEWDDFRKEIIHLIKVVDDMLLLALVDANPKIPLESQDLLDIVSESIVSVGPKSKDKNVSIRLNVDEKIYNSSEALERPVMADLLKSAIVNILDNAIDFSPRDGTVDIFVSTYGNFVKIQIKDYGPGISEELLPHLFTRFTRGNNVARKGSGLGLSITKKIIELHKGDIRVIEHKNGATFEIVL